MINNVRAEIETAIATEMAKAPAYPVAFQNAPFNPPNNESWVQFAIRFGDGQYATLVPPGDGFDQITGIIIINVYTPVGVGAATNYEIVERIKAIYSRATFGGIIFDPASGPSQVKAITTESGRSTAPTGLSASFYQTQTTISFVAFVN